MSQEIIMVAILLQQPVERKLAIVKAFLNATIKNQTWGLMVY